MSKIEDHDDWLARSQDEDFGVDAEAELTEGGVLGHIIKLQFKSTEVVKRTPNEIRITIDRKYIDYAKSCRYPVILIAADLTAREAWYLWLQKWILEERAKGERLQSQDSYSRWIPESATLDRGLDEDWKNIARWRTETQLVLSLIDTLKAATASYDEKLISHFVDLLRDVAPTVADSSLDILVSEAVYLGERIWGTGEGLTISQLLFPLIREFGGKLSKQSVIEMGQRGKSYSRTGLSGLCILYDEHFDRTSSYGLPDYFVEQELPEVAYYCALRETFPEKKYLDFMLGPGDFTFGGLRFVEPEREFFGCKYANRGPSAILDYLEIISDVADG